MIYLDTSVLVKRFVAEMGSAIIHDLLSREEVAGTATIALLRAAAAEHPLILNVDTASRF